MTRHSVMAEQMAPLLAAVRRPQSQSEPVGTNWSVTPANDNINDDVANTRVERRWAFRPTIGEIMRSVEDGPITYGTHVSDDGSEHKVVTGIGALKFSDGTHTEKGYVYGLDGKLTSASIVLPVGAMLGARDAQERMLGGGIQRSDSVYRKIYKARRARPLKSNGKKAPSRKIEARKVDLRRELAEAIANTQAHMPIKKCPTGFPWRPAMLADLFMGVEKGRRGSSGSIAWQDICTSTAEREVWAETIASLSAEDSKTLDKLPSANSMQSIGEVHGKRGKNAVRVGKRRLLALNDNIVAAYSAAIGA